MQRRNTVFLKTKITQHATHTVLSQHPKINCYFFLCLFFLKRFLRLWVAILCLFLFLPFGIILIFLSGYYLASFTFSFTSFTKLLAGLNAGI